MDGKMHRRTRPTLQPSPLPSGAITTAVSPSLSLSPSLSEHTHRQEKKRKKEKTREMQNVCQNHKQQQLEADEEKVLKRMMGEQPFSSSLSRCRSFLLLLRFSSVPVSPADYPAISRTINAMWVCVYFCLCVDLGIQNCEQELKK